MKLTSREKIMLAFLGAAAVIALCYFFLFKPQLEKIAGLTVQDIQSRQKVEQIKAELATGPKIDAEIAKLDTEIGEKTKGFYPEILDDKLLLVIDDLIKKAQVKSNSGAFADITVEKIEGSENGAGRNVKKVVDYPLKEMAAIYKNPAIAVNQTNAGTGTETAGAGAQKGAAKAANKSANKDEKPADVVENLSVTLNFTGTNDQLMSFIKEIEALNRTIIVNGMKVEAAENNLLKVEISVTFYALPKISEQDKDYFDWPYNGTYGKTNPYKAALVSKPVQTAPARSNTGGGSTGGGQSDELVP